MTSDCLPHQVRALRGDEDAHVAKRSVDLGRRLDRGRASCQHDAHRLQSRARSYDRLEGAIGDWERVADEPERTGRLL